MIFGKGKYNAGAARIQPVPDFKDKCCVCDEIRMGCHFDHDLAAINHGRGQVCDHCSGFVIMAEIVLRNARLTVPTDSILDGGMPPDPLQPE